MSNRAHSGSCFRSNRKTAIRKKRQGVEYESHPIRWKVPVALRPFLSGPANQARAQFEQMGTAINRYTQHRLATGIGAPVRAEGQPEAAPQAA